MGLKLSKLSFSSLQLYNLCPYKFHTVYVQGVKEPSSVHTVTGRALHKIMEKMFKQKKFHLSEWLTQWPQYLDKQLLKDKDIEISESDKQKFLASGYKHLTTIHSWLQKEDLLKPNLENELWFSCSYKDEITFNGLIDFVVDRGDYFLIGDYKFGKVISRDHKHQIMLYMAFFRKIRGIKNVKGVLIYPQNINKSHYIEPTEKLREETSKFFNDIYQRLIADTEFKPTKNKYCSNCFLYRQQKCPLFENTYVSTD